MFGLAREKLDEDDQYLMLWLGLVDGYSILCMLSEKGDRLPRPSM